MQLIVVYANQQASFHVSIGKSTRVALAEPGEGVEHHGRLPGALPAESRPARTTATEVVVLPAKALIGMPVTAVCPAPR